MQIYVVDVNDFSYLEGIELLNENRKKRVERYHFLDDKKRCLIGGLLLKYALKQDADKVIEGENGKLFLPNGKVEFNLSHAGEYVVLAVDEKSVGIDVENVRDYMPLIAKQCFLKEEREYMLSSQSQNQAFYEVWTGKESVIKLFGLGLKMNPKSFSVCPIQDGYRLINGKDVFIKWINFNNHVIALSSFEEIDANVVKLEKRQLL